MVDIFVKLFGSYNSRAVKKYEKIVKKINSLEESVSSLSDEELRGKTAEFKEALKNGATLDQILPKVFAVVRETSKRVLGMRHFDVQLIGGMALHDGCIAEMKTGEGKTLVATLAVYLNALSEKGVHVVTVNDYLAKRDAAWMGQIYKFLGMSVGTITSGMDDNQKRIAYNCDITYGTNHEYGFDYLRDNLKFSESDMVMRSFNFGVVDEVDSILIDEARTPLIISGVDQGSTQLYIAVNSVVKEVSEGDFEKDEKTRVVTLTDQGIEKVEKGLRQIGLLKESGLYDSHNISLVYHVNCALKAHKIFSLDVDYIVKNGEVMIIDEFTGRIMDGRRYSEGLHQAIEAKEGVEVKPESQTVATISYQNLFRLYPKLSGMTGTAMTEEAEFDEIYKLKVISIPPNRQFVRVDHNDAVYCTMKEKDLAVLSLIKECISREQPVLVGTASIERSEYISNLLSKEGIKHGILNARHHEQEARIISEAGAPGIVTISTNMAGRGTDIKLGGCLETRIESECTGITDPKERENKIQEIKEDIEKKHEIVKKAGGLFVIGTERNESRRIDNQLRGRSGRQGDPGASKFFLSLEDDLLRRVGLTNVQEKLQKMTEKEKQGTVMENRFFTKLIEKAQQRIEAYNFDIRKQLLKYDDVMNDQRKIVYSQRKSIMSSQNVSDIIQDMIEETLSSSLLNIAPASTPPSEWKMENLVNLCKNVFGIDIDAEEIVNDPVISHDVLKSRLEIIITDKYNSKVEKYGREIMTYIEKDVTLKVLDKSWRAQLVSLEHLRRGINLRAYAQKNPLNEYKFEAFNLFQDMLESVRLETLTAVFNFEFENKPRNSVGRGRTASKLFDSGMFDEDEIDHEVDFNDFEEENETDHVEKVVESTKREEVPQISRNSLCPCGSGKKYKYCCGAIELISKVELPTFDPVENEEKKEDSKIKTENKKEQVSKKIAKEEKTESKKLVKEVKSSEVSEKDTKRKIVKKVHKSDVSKSNVKKVVKAKNVSDESLNAKKPAVKKSVKSSDTRKFSEKKNSGAGMEPTKRKVVKKKISDTVSDKKPNKKEK